MKETETPVPTPWLNRTTLGVGLTSLFSDWSHEMATTILPAFLAVLGAGPGWLGAIEGISDGLSSLTKLVAGHYTDRRPRRKPVVILGYLLTAAGIGALAMVTNAAQVLACRASAWLGRGMRTPGRKTLMAADVPQEAYGRAFGFERMMDTLGAIFGPLTALWILEHTQHDYRRVLLWTLVPGSLAVLSFWILVRERPIVRALRPSFWHGLRALPNPFRKFLVAVGIFGMGDFSHTMLILFATQQLAPSIGMTRAASLAIGFYTLHNFFYAGSAYVGGWLGDRARQRNSVLAAGYALAGATAILLCLSTGRLGASPSSLLASPLTWMLALIFAMAGTFVGVVEALEDSLAAELVPAPQHGMAFGTLAAINAAGDLVSSLFVGFLWTNVSVLLAFAAAGVLFVSGAFLVMRLRGTT
jgi:MFS family permease